MSRWSVRRRNWRRLRPQRGFEGSGGHKTMKHYKAHWGTSLVVVSLLATVSCLGIALVVLKNGGTSYLTALLLLAIVIGSAPFTIRGYTVTPEAILVHRLFWVPRLPRTGLQSAVFEPDAMHRSIRTFGNGGLFSFSGFYRNKTLGAYRAFVTDPHQTVVLRYSGRTVVVSPSTPEEFAHDLGSKQAGNGLRRE